MYQIGLAAPVATPIGPRVMAAFASRSRVQVKLNIRKSIYAGLYACGSLERFAYNRFHCTAELAIAVLSSLHVS